MLEKISYDPESKTLFIKRSGILRSGELLEDVLKLSKLSGFSEAKKILSDFQDIEPSSKITNIEVRNHALFCRDNLSRFQIVILAPADIVFGLGRMFEVFSEIKNVAVVRTMKEALKRLGLDKMPEY